MADDVQQTIRNINSINWREVFPFLHLFRTFRVAVHPSKLMLALAGLLLIYAGGRSLDAVWPDARPGLGGVETGVFARLFAHEVEQVNTLARNVLHGQWVGGIY